MTASERIREAREARKPLDEQVAISDSSEYAQYAHGWCPYCKSYTVDRRKCGTCGRWF